MGDEEQRIYTREMRLVSDPLFGIIILGIIGLFIWLHFKRMSIKDLYNQVRGK